MISPPLRHRILYAALLFLTILIGLASRHFSHDLPALLSKNAVDILYATLAFWLTGLLGPRQSTGKAAVIAFAFCIVIECAKFIQAPWLVAVRRQTWGHLIFGSGFHLSNLVCYAIGVLLGVGIECALQHRPAAVNARLPGSQR